MSVIEFRLMFAVWCVAREAYGMYSETAIAIAMYIDSQRRY